MQVAQPFRQIRRDKFHEQILCVWVDVRRVLDFPFQDVLVDFHRRAAIPERCESAEHFENEDP